MQYEEREKNDLLHVKELSKTSWGTFAVPVVEF